MYVIVIFCVDITPNLYNKLMATSLRGMRGDGQRNGNKGIDCWVSCSPRWPQSLKSVSSPQASKQHLPYWYWRRTSSGKKSFNKSRTIFSLDAQREPLTLVESAVVTGAGSSLSHLRVFSCKTVVLLCVRRVLSSIIDDVGKICTRTK